MQLAPHRRSPELDENRRLSTVRSRRNVRSRTCRSCGIGRHSDRASSISSGAVPCRRSRMARLGSRSRTSDVDIGPSCFRPWRYRDANRADPMSAMTLASAPCGRPGCRRRTNAHGQVVFSDAVDAAGQVIFGAETRFQNPSTISRRWKENRLCRALTRDHGGISAVTGPPERGRHRGQAAATNPEASKNP